MADDRMDDDRLKALLSQEISSALTYDDTELSQKRATALEYYRGEMSDTPAMQGRSSVVSKDVADTIGWMLPGIIRVFTASDRMVVYEPEKPGDEQFADQATDYVNYIFMRENPGYRILWDSTHDSLLLANGIVKHWWDDAEECEYSEHSGLTEEQLAILQMDQGNIEITAQKQGEPQIIYVPNQMGQPIEMQVPTFDVKVKRVTRRGRLRVECISPEDFLINREAKTIEDARFTAHRSDTTRSKLIEMGFDKDLVEGLPIDRFSSIRQESISRSESASVFFNNVGDDSMLLVELFECYVKADVDGDGVAETVRAFYAGAAGTGELLDWEVWDDDVPFSDIPCEPIPHRWDARSVYDDTADIQRVKTVLTRQFLDNTYWVNNPMTAAEEQSIANPETLRSPKFGSTVYFKKGSVPPQPLAIPYIGDKALLALQHFDNVREMRTGVSRSTMALDPEALQNQTATANQNSKDSAYSQIELIARNQAELGWRRVFKQLLKLIVKHQDRPRSIRLRDTWVEMDPRAWNANMDVTINIGLGTGSRDRDMAMLNTILNVQMGMTDRLAAGGFAQQALDMVPKINLTAIKLAESAGIKNPDQFYLDLKPETLQQMKMQAAQPQEDPKLTQIRLQAQLDQQAANHKAQIETLQAQADIATQNRKTEAEMIQTERDFQLKKELALIQAALDQEKHRNEEARKDREHAQRMQQGAQAHEHSMQSREQESMARAQKADPKGHGAAAIKQREATISLQKESLAQQDKKLDAILGAVQAIARPRKRVIHRDQSGRATHATEEIIN